MKIIKQSWSFESLVDGPAILHLIESAGRTCYKSESGSQTLEQVKAFCTDLIRRGHHSVLEHASISVRIITDRGVTHEIVRHRLCSYSQESTRYCNYSKDKFGNEITVILPVWFYKTAENTNPTMGYEIWYQAMRCAAQAYFSMLNLKHSPQEARTVLPNSLKTEIVMTCNVREWRHFFTLRCSSKAHPQMRELVLSMLKGFRGQIPVLFDDIPID